MSKGNHSPKTKTALAVLTDSSVVINDRSALKAFQKTTAEQVTLINTTETNNVLRRVFVGLALHRIKASLKHGEWGTWKKDHLSIKPTQLHYVMGAAQAFVSEAGFKPGDSLALATTEVALDTKDATARKVVAAAEKFVGGMTWGELLDAHDIRETKKVGGPRAKETNNDPAPALTPEQMYQLKRDEIGSFLTQACRPYIAGTAKRFGIQDIDTCDAADLRKVAGELEQHAARVARQMQQVPEATGNQPF
jgi:hypothetical protein